MGALPRFMLGLLPIRVMAWTSLEAILLKVGWTSTFPQNWLWKVGTQICLVRMAPHSEGLEAVGAELVSHEASNLLQKTALVKVLACKKIGA